MRDGAGDIRSFDLSDRLRARGWQVAAYTMVPNIADMAVMRVLIRHGFSLDSADALLEDIRRSLEYFKTHPISKPMTAAGRCLARSSRARKAERDSKPH